MEMMLYNDTLNHDFKNGSLETILRELLCIYSSLI